MGSRPSGPSLVCLGSYARWADGGEMAIVLVEQFYDFAEELADAYTVMARGQVVAQGVGSEMPEKGIRELVAI